MLFLQSVGSSQRAIIVTGIAAAALAGAPALSHAAEVDAGSLQQQIERNQSPKLPPVSAPLPARQPLAQQPRVGGLVTLKQFRFTGNSKLSEQALNAALAQYQGQSLSFSQLESAVLDVSEAYREAGWVVRAFLPEQDVVDGIVLIQIVEAVLGEVLINDTVPGSAPASTLKKIIQTQQASGQLLSATALDRALLIADDISGAYVSGSLQEGQKDGQTDLVLKLQGKPAIDGSLTTDNTGSVSTGITRLLGNVSVNNLLGGGDVLSTQLLSTQGSKYIRLGGSVPLGVGGLRAGINASRLDYHVLQLAAELAVKGSSDTSGLELSYPLVRSRLQNLYVNLGVDNKKFKNFSGGEIATEYSNKIFSLALSGNQFDNVGGGGSNTGNLTVSQGNLNLDGSPNADDVAATTQTAGLYRKLRYAISRQQAVSTQLSVYAALSGQWANKNLDSSEKFYLGGSGGVRAYPSSEGGGAIGHMANLELRWQVAAGYSWVGFFDIGQVTVNRYNNFSSAAAPNDFVLRGAGVAINWQLKNGLALKTIWARRLGKNPNANIETGNDQDGSLVRDRFWLSANFAF